jgi:hypothetical protein
MIALVLAILCGAARPDLDAAIALAREGQFTEALLAADAEPDPVKRAQARLYVRHHAGDIEGALREVDDARARGAGSEWLDEREAYIALSLRDLERSRSALERLRGAGPDLAAKVASYRAEADALDATLAARDRGVSHARWVALAFGLAALAGGAWWSRRGEVSRVER